MTARRLHIERQRKCKTNLKQKEASHKRQQKLRKNQNCTIQAIAEQTGAKLSKKWQEDEKHVDNEELIAAISQIAISASPDHERRPSKIIGTVKTLDQLAKALTREGCNLKK